MLINIDYRLVKDLFILQESFIKEGIFEWFEIKKGKATMNDLALEVEYGSLLENCAWVSMTAIFLGHMV